MLYIASNRFVVWRMGLSHYIDQDSGRWVYCIDFVVTIIDWISLHIFSIWRTNGINDGLVITFTTFRENFYLRCPTYDLRDEHPVSFAQLNNLTFAPLAIGLFALFSSTFRVVSLFLLILLF